MESKHLPKLKYENLNNSINIKKSSENVVLLQHRIKHRVFGLESVAQPTQPNLMPFNGCFSLHHCLLRIQVDEHWQV